MESAERRRLPDDRRVIQVIEARSFEATHKSIVTTDDEQPLDRIAVGRGLGERGVVPTASGGDLSPA